MADKLTDKQEQFCQEYLIDLNATQAAIRAGYSEKTAKEQGYENLTKPHIQERVAELMSERSERTEITADEIALELKALGFAGKDDEHIKPSDKIRALELLGKHVGMFTDKSEVKHSGDAKWTVEVVRPKDVENA